MTASRKRLSITAATLIAFLLAVPAGLALTQPTLAALVCPRCFGFAPHADGLYVESGMPDETRAQLSAALTEARQKVGAFYGGMQTTPRILACATRGCVDRIGGGGGKGAAYLTFGLRLAPDGIDPAVIAHELSHVELHGRIGLLNFWTGAVPTWFDEGLAAVVADDPRYFLPAGAGDRCRTSPEGTMPERREAWIRTASRDHALYARAACRVLRWVQRNGGHNAVLRLVARVNDGEAFGPVYLKP